MLYFRFIICLAAGLFGLALLMSTVMESVLVDWDMASDLRAFIDRLSSRNKRRYVLIGDGHGQIRIGQAPVTHPARRAMEKEFLASSGLAGLQIPVPPPAGPPLKRIDILAPNA